MGSAQAAPDIQGVEVTKISAKKVEVLVETLRGTAAAQPRIRVAVARRSARAKVQDWDPSLAAADIVDSLAKVSHVRSRVESTVSVRIRACDTSCTTITRDVTVAADDTRVGGRTDPTTPLPPGSIDATGAVKVATDFVGAGSTLIGIERSDDYGVAWEVKVQRTDGARVKVYVGADGTVLRSRADKSPKACRDHKTPAPVPPAAITADQAVTIALAKVGAGSTLLGLRRENDHGALWKVTVLRADGAQVRVYIKADGTVLTSHVNHWRRLLAAGNRARRGRPDPHRPPPTAGVSWVLPPP